MGPAALTRHVALVGFMGSGKSSLGAEAAARLGRPFVDVDAELEREVGLPIARLWAERGEAAFRELEEELTVEALADAVPAVLSLGGGAILSERVREALRARAVAVLVEVDVDEAWARVAGSERPLAQDEGEFRRLYEEREALYQEVADARTRDVDGIALAAAGVHVEPGALGLLGSLVPGAGRVALVSDPHVAGIHGADAQLALGARLDSTHELPPGEEAKTLEAVGRLWDDLRLDRGGTLVALGGGCTTDAGGFAASAYLRGIAWVPVPTTLVGQVDAAIGGKTAVNLRGGKNLVGAFHWPAATVVDPSLLATLPEGQRREGLAEVVKTGLLAGEPLWELPEPELVRRCAAFKAAVCLRDPHDRGPRNVLNLGHTFAHALEAAAGYEGVTHGRAVALGLLAALRLSGVDDEPVRRLLDPRPVRVDRERAWAALRRDKKAADGRLRLVLLDAPGRPRWGVEVPEDDVRAALDALIAG
ncbi:MAG TPA: bifunctional shikimate kinase/3-dehydroquinate synthase [Gaiellaceae bacterium]|nr:bifunctional shikimate kinase/3-dehydroquinate synthase [Gaiellaceae bacterium]